MQRRQILGALAALFAAPPATFAQQGTQRRVGFLYLGSRQSAIDRRLYDAFLQGMREHGYNEGRNYVLHSRFADGRYEDLPMLVQDLLQSKVEVIVATGTPAYRVLRGAAVPVVVTVSVDPVQDGLAKSLSHPGGNFTGISLVQNDLFPKHVEFLKAALPALARVGVLANPGHVGHPAVFKSVEAFARKLNVNAVQATARTPAEIERAFALLSNEAAQAVVILGDPFFAQQYRQIAGLAVRYRMASTYTDAAFAEAGGFLTYGPSFAANYRRVAAFVDKILKGARPGDLPFEEPAKLDLVINRGTAKAIGVVIPSTVLARADRVID